MATLQLNLITCIDQQERGDDELYVTFAGTRTALPNMNQGDTVTLDYKYDFFGGSKGLSLFENDGNHWYDRDDFIDRHTITESPGHFMLDFIGAGAHYELDVSVV